MSKPMPGAIPRACDCTYRGNLADNPRVVENDKKRFAAVPTVRFVSAFMDRAYHRGSRARSRHAARGDQFTPRRCFLTALPAAPRFTTGSSSGATADPAGGGELAAAWCRWSGAGRAGCAPTGFRKKRHPEP